MWQDWLIKKTGLEETMPEETNDDWAAAPKDGSVINVQFSDGSTKARWNSQAAGGGQWEIADKNGRWIDMGYSRGRSTPIRWWR